MTMRNKSVRGNVEFTQVSKYIPVPQTMDQTIGTSIASKCTRPRVRRIRHARQQGPTQTIPRRIDKICSVGTIDIAMVSE